MLVRIPGVAIAAVLFAAATGCHHDSSHSVTCPVPAADEVRAVTFNIHSGTKGMDKVTDSLKDMAADVIGLEEVDRGAARSDGVDQPTVFAQALGFYPAYAHEATVEGGEEGLLILSRWPIGNTQVTTLEATADFTYILFEAQIQAPAPIGTFTFAVTHLNWVDPAKRLAQAQVLLPHVQGQDRTILVGDFNATPDEAAITLLSGSLTDTLAGQPEAVSFPNDKKRIDYIFLSPDLTATCAEVADESGSDHRPVLANVRFPP